MSSAAHKAFKVLITGANGQLGRALCASVPSNVQLSAFSRTELDIGELVSVQRCIATLRPDVVINAAAYTAVDKAESDVTTAEHVNAVGPHNLALALSTQAAARLIHISTDFVFDGGHSRPYAPDAAPAPLGTYGRTKLAGERVVQKILAERALIVRTAWIYDATGKNFLRTMLRLMSERDTVRVVMDQVGTPTSAQSLAQVLWQFAQRCEVSGIYHWTDAGVASWYDFAVAIAEEAHAVGLLKSLPQVMPIATADYPTPARRPAYSVLDKSATYAALQLAPVHWRVALREVMRHVQL